MVNGGIASYDLVANATYKREITTLYSEEREFTFAHLQKFFLQNFEFRPLNAILARGALKEKVIICSSYIQLQLSCNNATRRKISTPF